MRKGESNEKVTLQFRRFNGYVVRDMSCRVAEAQPGQTWPPDPYLPLSWHS
jgi:hypothetical protein